jgi:hypothetical protein
MLPFGWIETRYSSTFPPLMPNTIGPRAAVPAPAPHAVSASAIAASQTTLRTRRE